jgi:two-component system NtrC family sensor kinase
LLADLRTVDMQLSESDETLMIGTLIGMRRALWAPIATQHRLRGVIFAGSRKKRAHLPQGLMESMAAELAAAIEQWVGREPQEASRRASAVPTEMKPPDEIVADNARQRVPQPLFTAHRVFQSKLQTDRLAELGRMVTGIAHELSNPLTSILGYAQRLLLRSDSTGDYHEARQIFQEAERATAILRQLLLSATESRPERRRVALNQVITRSLELQCFSLAAGDVHVQLDLEPVLPFVLGDAGQLQQVLMNLIGNARQAIEEQGKGGTIRVKSARASDKRVLLQVSDDGPGIPHAIQARIFDPFFTTKPPGSGTGLGLSIVLGIVREHGGQLHLTSKPGRGTIFSIELPAIAASELPLPATGGAAPLQPRLESPHSPGFLEILQASATLAPWAGTRVLVLEDEPTVARLIADVLEDEGLRVDVLLDSREALNRVAREDYALAICDMRMPVLDGEHFYQALARAQNPLRERFLFVTGDVLAAHTRDFLESNHLPYVAKPFRVEELTKKIRAVLESTSPLQPSHDRATNNIAAAST